MTAAAAGEKHLARRRGGDLVGQSTDYGLFDEVLLCIAPVTLGGGAPLLPRRLTGSDLLLIDVPRDGQFVRLTYAVDAGR